MSHFSKKTYGKSRMFFCFVFTLIQFYDILTLVYAEGEKKKASTDAFWRVVRDSNP